MIDYKIAYNSLLETFEVMYAEMKELKTNNINLRKKIESLEGKLFPKEA